MPKKNIQPYSEEYNKLEMMELAENNIEAPIINIFHMFKKVEENMSMLKREMEDIDTKRNF